MAKTTDRPWDGSASRFSDEEWKASCQLDRGPAFTTPKTRYALPVYEPGTNTLNIAALYSAGALIHKVKGASPAALKAAAKRLLKLYAAIGKTPPEALLRLAGAAAEARAMLGEVEERSAPETLQIEGRKLRGVVPYSVQSRDLGGWSETLRPGCLANADLSDLVCTVDHQGLPLGRHPGTLEVEDRADGLHWSVELPESRADVREAVERGDLRACSWRMVVGRDSWTGNVRTVEEVRSLRDVSVVTTPAYPAATAEYRAAPIEEDDEVEVEEQVAEEVEVEEVEARSAEGGGLRVEDRVAEPDAGGTVEERILDSLRSVGKGETRSLTQSMAYPISPPELSSYLFDRLAPKSVALASGIRVIVTDRRTIQWPGIVSDPSPGWYGEAEEIPATDPAFRTLEATPKKTAIRVEFSNEVIDDSEPSAADVVRRLMLRALAEKLDLAVYEGDPDTDAESIRGLKFTPAIQTISMGDNGAAVTSLDIFADAIARLEAVDTRAGRSS